MLGSEDTEVNRTDKMFPFLGLYFGDRLRGASNTMQTLTNKVRTVKSAAGGNN